MHKLSLQLFISFICVFNSSIAYPKQCLNVFAYINWFGFTINAITLNPPLEMKQADSFVAGSGYDYQVRYQTKISPAGDVVLVTQLKGLVDDCQEPVTRTYKAETRKSYDGGELVCGTNAYQLYINVNGIVEREACE